MSTLGLSQSTAIALYSLFAQADALVLAADVPFSIFKVVFLVGWVCGCLYIVRKLENDLSVPSQYRPIFQIASVFFGPLVLAALVPLTKGNPMTGSLVAARSAGGTNPAESGPPIAGKRNRRVNPITQWVYQAKGAILKIWSSGSRDDEEPTLRLFDSAGAELSEIYGHGDRRGANKHTLNLTAQLIDNALAQRASDILIDPKDQNTYAIRFRIDGALRTVHEFPVETTRTIINSVKAVSSMDISDRRRPQDGAFTAKKGPMAASFRVASAGALNGEKLSIRVLNRNVGDFTLADVGIPEHQCAALINAIHKPAGMVLVCGPTGSGKTTTLYSMLNQIDRLTRNVVTVEDPIEAHLKDASQIEINAKAGITFAKALRSILRQDPDVISVGEIRDEETASIALRAAQTGHLVLATIHCESNPTALIRLLDLGVSPMLLSSGLNLLISQRLVRKLCDQCKRPATLPASVIEGFRSNGIDPSQICEAVGCEHCGGTGYYGRLAICDLLQITDALRAEIANSGTIVGKLRSEGEKKGRASLKSEALRNVILGITSLDELKRVVG